MESKGVKKTDATKPFLYVFTPRPLPSFFQVCMLFLYLAVGTPVALLYVKMYPTVLPCLARSNISSCVTTRIVFESLMFWLLALAWPGTALVSVVPFLTVLLVNVGK
jgi:hypothetical protein